MRQVLRRIWRYVAGYRVCRWKPGAEGRWNEATKWVGGRTPRHGDDIVVSNGTLHLNGCPRIHTLTILEGTLLIKGDRPCPTE